MISEPPLRYPALPSPELARGAILKLQGWRAFAVTTTAVLLIASAAVAYLRWAPGPSRQSNEWAAMRHSDPPLSKLTDAQLWLRITTADDELESRGRKPGLKSYYASRLDELTKEEKARTKDGLAGEETDPELPPTHLHVVAGTQKVGRP